MQLIDLFDGALVGQAAETAVEFDGPGGGAASLTFGELAARSLRLARLFESRGLRAGDRLAIHLANRIEFVDVLLACLRLGVVLVPINVLYREREIAHILADAAPAAVVTTRSTFDRFTPAAGAASARMWAISRSR